MHKLRWFAVGVIYLLMVSIHATSPSLPLALGVLSFLAILFIFSGLILGACVSTWGNPIAPNPSAKVLRLATAGLGGLFVQVCLGSFVRHSHSGLACPNFPLCLTSFFPIPFTFETNLAFFHRWWGVLMIGLFAHLAIAAAKQMPSVAGPSRRAFGLAVAQVFIGVGTVMSGLNPESRTIHAAIGYALWGILFYILIRSGGLQRLWNKKDRSTQ